MRSKGFLALASLLLLTTSCGCGPTRVEQLLEAAHSDDIDEQRTALRELADVGPDAASAFPDFIELSEHRHPDVRRLSGLALGRIASTLSTADDQHHETEVQAVLTRLLDDPELAVRNTAAFALLDLDPDHPVAQQRVLSAMKQGDGGIIDRLTHTKPAPAWAIPTLSELVSHDSRPGIRRLAVVALGKIDPQAPEAQKKLQSALQDRDDRVREAARDALARGS